MTTPELTFVATTDLAGKLRGKAVPGGTGDGHRPGPVGWVPTNALITCFDTIGDGPYGSLGDLAIVPDMQSLCHLPGSGAGDGIALVLGDVCDLDGAPWACCTRSILRAALDRLHALTGLHLQVAFEHEFQLDGLDRPLGDAFTFEGLRASGAFATDLMAALDRLGFEPEQFIREYGPDQFEVTIRPTDAVAACDRAAVFRALVRDMAERSGQPATFSPIGAPGGVGNGVHIHASLRRDDGTPATHDAVLPGGLTHEAGQMAAGIAKYLPDVMALLAPSVISYARLTPHRWSAAFNNIGHRDREAALRICPVSEADPNIAAKYNLELRAVDAAASPHLALAAMAHAMAQGVEEALPLPEVTSEDLSVLDPATLARRQISRLPETLDAALDRFRVSETMRAWFGAEFVEVYDAHKTAEIAFAAEQETVDLYRLYRETY